MDEVKKERDDTRVIFSFADGLLPQQVLFGPVSRIRLRSAILPDILNIFYHNIMSYTDN